MKVARVLLLPFLLSLPAFAAQGDEAPLPSSSGAHDLLSRVMSEASIAQSPPKPSPSEYFADLVTAFAAFLERWLKGLFGVLPGPGVLRALAWGLIAVLVTLLLWIAASAFLKRRPKPPRPAASLEMTERPVVAPADPGFWRDRTVGFLERGEIAEALAALWFYFAHSIGKGEVDPSWTIRDLLRRRERGDLQSLGRRLEFLLYGPRAAGAADVRAFLTDLEKAVG